MVGLISWALAGSSSAPTVLIDTVYGQVQQSTIDWFCVADHIVLGTTVNIGKAHWRYYQTVGGINTQDIRTPVSVKVDLNITGSAPSVVTYSTPYGRVDGVYRVPVNPGRQVNPNLVVGSRYFLAFSFSPADTMDHDKGMLVALAALNVPEGVTLPSSAKIKAEAAKLREKHCE